MIEGTKNEARHQAQANESSHSGPHSTVSRTVAVKRSPAPNNVDHLLVAALVAGATYETAALRAGCSASTVERRLSDPQFSLRLVEAKNDILDRLLGASASAALVATDYLLRVVVGDERDATHTHRIRAAIALRSGLDRLDSHIAGSS